MMPIVQEIVTQQTPEWLVEQLRGESGVVLLRSALFDSPQERYSLMAANPFLTFRSFGSRCEITVSDSPQSGRHTQLQYGNPWQLLDALMARCELLDEVDLPFPLGGCFGYWGYDLKNFAEPKLPRHAVNDLELPDCHVGFYDSLVVFDHRLGKTWIVSTGLNADGSRNDGRAAEQLGFWRSFLNDDAHQTLSLFPKGRGRNCSCARNNPSATNFTLTRNRFTLSMGERARVSAGVARKHNKFVQILPAPNSSPSSSVPNAASARETFIKSTFRIA